MATETGVFVFHFFTSQFGAQKMSNKPEMLLGIFLLSYMTVQVKLETSEK